jgi:hypothetical protein
MRNVSSIHTPPDAASAGDDTGDAPRDGDALPKLLALLPSPPPPPLLLLLLPLPPTLVPEKR